MFFQLKKLINQVVIELSSLGLNPAVLQRFITGPGQPHQAVSPSIQSVSNLLDTSEPDYAAVYEVTSQLFTLNISSRELAERFAFQSQLK